VEFRARHRPRARDEGAPAALALRLSDEKGSVGGANGCALEARLGHVRRAEQADRFAEYLREWIEAIKPTVRPTTWASYKGNVEQHLIPAIGSIPLQQLGAPRLNVFYAKLLENGRKDGRKGGLSARSVRYVHAILHRALSDAVRWNRLARNVADAADRPRAGRPEMKTWTATELRAFLGHVADDEFSTAYLLLAMTGAGRGEVLGLRWRDVDLDGGRLSIIQTLIAPGYKLAFSTPKNGKPRSIAVDPGTVEALRTQRKRQLEQRLAFGPDWPDTDLVFTHADGTPVNPVLFSKRFDRAVKASGLPTIRLHDLRHSHATLALRAGIHPKVVSERLGHSTVGITLDVYSHVTEPMEQAAAATVAALVLEG
jgi:integrase